MESSTPLFAADAASAPRPGAIRTLPRFGLPLFWRIVAVNVVVVFGGALLATVASQQLGLGRSITPLAHSAIVLAAIALAAGLTLLQLRESLRPIRSLHKVIERFNAGDRSARAEVDPAADPEIAALALEVNALWDRLEADAHTIREKTEQAERLAAQVISAQEDERRRVSRELHDEAGQALTALIIGLERGLAQMPDVYAAHLPIQPRQLISDLRDLAAGTLDEVRNLAFELRPTVLDDLGLAAALRQYVRGVEERTGLATRLTVSGVDDQDSPGERLPPAVETALFRIAQEALTNAVRHARATRVQVQLRRTDDAVSLEVRDDGDGLPAAYIGSEPGPADGHLGLFGMRERARLLGGSLRVAPVSPRGTLVAATLPLASVGTGPSVLLGPGSGA